MAAPRPVIRGNNGPLLQRFEYTYDPSRGYSGMTEYEGFDEIKMRNLMQPYISAGMGCRLVGEYDKFTLQIYDSDNQQVESIIDTWQIAQNELQISSLLNPRNITNVSETDLIIIGKFHAGSIEYDTALSSITASNPYATRLLKRIQQGSTHYSTGQYVLRHTTNVGNRTTFNVSDANVDCIYTVSQLISECANSGLWVFPIPPRLITKINLLPFPPVRTGYQNGWLKRGSTETTGANNRIDITTEYWMGQISTDEYALKS